MKNRILWLAIAATLIAVAIYFAQRPPPIAPVGTAPRTPPSAPTRHAAPESAHGVPTPVATPAVPATPVTAPTAMVPAAQKKNEFPPPIVPIQEGATIDFSIGAPVVRSGGADTEALERSLKEMAAATKDVSFPPAKKTSTEPAPKK